LKDKLKSNIDQYAYRLCPNVRHKLNAVHRTYASQLMVKS